MEGFIIIVAIVFFTLAVIATKKAEKKQREQQEDEYRKRKVEEEKKKKIIGEIVQGLFCVRLNEVYHNDLPSYIMIILNEHGLGSGCRKIRCNDDSVEIVYRLPGQNEISRIKETKVLKNGEIRENYYSDRDFAKVYENSVLSLCLRVLDCVFKSDPQDKIGYVVLNGYAMGHSPSTGQLEKKTIVSIMADKCQFEGIDLAYVDPKVCFKSLGGVSGAKLIDLSPVTPIITFDKNDKRFIKGEDVSINKGTNLAAMDWQDFEQLVREVFQKRFEKDGWDVNVTRASRDGGVDAIIYNPDPLTGGKILVQAKRYTNTVGVSAVRDLYGAMTDERASRGILITTSDYGSDSLYFAKDKPITLLNGGHLLGMLHEIGMEGYINIQEAKDSLKTG